jgi:hypothetical protein
MYYILFCAFTMENIYKRFALFLLFCIPSRIFITYLAYTVPLQYLRWMGYVALLPAFGFMYLYISGTRTTGLETFGDKIWWNNLRPIHSLLYFLFSINAIREKRRAWQYLFSDVILGLSSFIYYHFYENNSLAF